MNAIRIEATIQADGELHLSQLPCRKGDRVEVAVFIPDHDKDEATREAARQRFLARARAAKFRSPGPYPKRDELYYHSIGIVYS